MNFYEFLQWAFIVLNLSAIATMFLACLMEEYAYPLYCAFICIGQWSLQVIASTMVFFVNTILPVTASLPTVAFTKMYELYDTHHSRFRRYFPTMATASMENATNFPIKYSSRHPSSTLVSEIEDDVPVRFAFFAERDKQENQSFKPHSLQLKKEQIASRKEQPVQKHQQQKRAVNSSSSSPVVPKVDSVSPQASPMTKKLHQKIPIRKQDELPKTSKYESTLLPPMIFAEKKANSPVKAPEIQHEVMTETVKSSSPISVSRLTADSQASAASPQHDERCNRTNYVCHEVPRSPVIFQRYEEDHQSFEPATPAPQPSAQACSSASPVVEQQEIAEPWIPLKTPQPAHDASPWTAQQPQHPASSFLQPLSEPVRPQLTQQYGTRVHESYQEQQQMPDTRVYEAYQQQQMSDTRVHEAYLEQQQLPDSRVYEAYRQQQQMSDTQVYAAYQQQQVPEYLEPQVFVQNYQEPEYLSAQYTQQPYQQQEVEETFASSLVASPFLTEPPVPCVALDEVAAAAAAAEMEKIVQEYPPPDSDDEDESLASSSSGSHFSARAEGWGWSASENDVHALLAIRGAGGFKF